MFGWSFLNASICWSQKSRCCASSGMTGYTHMVTSPWESPAEPQAVVVAASAATMAAAIARSFMVVPLVRSVSWRGHGDDRARVSCVFGGEHGEVGVQRLGGPGVDELLVAGGD